MIKNFYCDSCGFENNGEFSDPNKVYEAGWRVVTIRDRDVLLCPKCSKIIDRKKGMIEYENPWDLFFSAL